jgi:hypothetical protein
MHCLFLDADGLPIVQKYGAYFSGKLDRSIVPIKNIEHNSEAVSFFHYSGNTRQQHPPNTLPTKSWSDKEVFQENTRALKVRIVVEEEGVARRYDVANSSIRVLSKGTSFTVAERIESIDSNPRPADYYGFIRNLLLNMAILNIRWRNKAKRRQDNPSSRGSC